MASAALARNVIGILGNVISFCLFLSPASTFYEIIKKRVVEEEFEKVRYVPTVLTCALWVFYGMPFVHPHHILVCTNNGIGLVIHLIYVTIFCIYTTNKALRKTVLVFLLCEAIFFTALVLLTMLRFPHKRSEIVFFCVFFCVELELVPLFYDMGKVIKTKSVRSMSFWFSLTYFLNGVCWATYSSIKPSDDHILATSFSGVILGIVQLILYACYSTCKGKSQQVHHVDLELGN